MFDKQKSPDLAALTGQQFDALTRAFARNHSSISRRGTLQGMVAIGATALLSGLPGRARAAGGGTLRVARALEFDHP